LEICGNNEENMIVDIGESIKRVVYGIGFYTKDSSVSVWIQFDENYEDTSAYETLCLFDLGKIIDPRIPLDWILQKSELGYELHPKNLTFEMLEEAQDNTNYECLVAMNEVRSFHNFPLINIPDDICPLEELERRRMEAERKKIEDQLDEYLRIGEEIALEKQKIR
jgi:hypothetical protein